MRVGPIRALVWMWLLCSVWLCGMWWLQSLSAPTPQAWAPAALVLGGGLALLGLVALYLGLSLRIEQARLRTQVREVLRGGDAGAATDGGDWSGLLDDLRAEARRQQRECERLQQAVDQAQERARQHAAEAELRASRAVQAAELATAALQRAGQGLEQAMAELPAVAGLGEPGGAQVEPPRAGGAQALADLGSGLRALQLQAQPVLDWLEAAPQASAGSEPGAEFLARATHLAESLQLLCLNFRLALERLGASAVARAEGLDTMVQDLEPLCAQATGLLEAVSQAGSPGGVPGPLREAGRHAAERLQDLQAALERAQAQAAQPRSGDPEAAAALDGVLDGVRGALGAALRQVRDADPGAGG